MVPRARRSRTPWRLLAFGSVPVLLVAVGTIGFHAIERWPWFNALYASVITLTSIGYEGTHALSSGGRVFTMALAVGGIFTVAAAATEILGIIITGEFRTYRESRRMSRRIEALEQHVIVCGHGHVGERVCRDLQEDGVPYVVVDRRAEALAPARELGALAVLGDATVDETLHTAGIGRARALIATAGTDPENVLITMTARLLSSALPIVARAEEEIAVPKLLRAGATRTICPHVLAGDRLAQAVLRPALLDLLDGAASRRYPDLHLEEQIVRAGDPFDGTTLAQGGLRAQPERLVVAIKQPDGHLTFNPGSEVPVVAGDTLVVLTVEHRTHPHRRGRAP